MVVPADPVPLQHGEFRLWRPPASPLRNTRPSS
jgi:hypothetical protein